jgi:hypothetical protein
MSENSQPELFPSLPDAIQSLTGILDVIEPEAVNVEKYAKNTSFTWQQKENCETWFIITKNQVVRGYHYNLAAQMNIRSRYANDPFPPKAH